MRCLSGAIALTLASKNGSYYMLLDAFYKPRVLPWVVEFQQVLRMSCSVTAGWVSKGWTNTSMLQM